MFELQKLFSLQKVLHQVRFLGFAECSSFVPNENSRLRQASYKTKNEQASQLGAPHV